MSDLIPPPFISSSPPSSPNNQSNLDQTDGDLGVGMNISLRQDVDEQQSSKNIDWDPFNTSQTDQIVETAITDDWASFNQTEAVKEVEDDDEFTDFIDNAQEMPQVIRVEPDPPVVLKEKLSLSVPIHSETICPLFDYVDAVEQVFDNVNSLNIQSESTSTLLQDQVSQNETWQELKKYTSINDASISLQFKWYLSNLEELYLDALSLERIAQNSKKKNAILSPNYVSSTILQPVKLEASVNSENKKTLAEQKPSNVDISSPIDSEKPPPPPSVTNLDPTAAPINIDLSYFESQISKESKVEPTGEASKAKPDGKKYLDQLLKDIYVKDNEPEDNNKTVSKSDQNDSNNHLNSMSEEAQELASRLPDLSFMKSKTLVVPTLKTTSTPAAATTTTK